MKTFAAAAALLMLGCTDDARVDADAAHVDADVTDAGPDALVGTHRASGTWRVTFPTLLCEPAVLSWELQFVDDSTWSLDFESATLGAADCTVRELDASLPLLVACGPFRGIDQVAIHMYIDDNGTTPTARVLWYDDGTGEGTPDGARGCLNENVDATVLERTR
jgi:hypothetical protein